MAGTHAWQGFDMLWAPPAYEARSIKQPDPRASGVVSGLRSGDESGRRPVSRAESTEERGASGNGITSGAESALAVSAPSEESELSGARSATGSGVTSLTSVTSSLPPTSFPASGPTTPPDPSGGVVACVSRAASGAELSGRVTQTPDLQSNPGSQAPPDVHGPPGAPTCFVPLPLLEQEHTRTIRMPTAYTAIVFEPMGHPPSDARLSHIS
jgi:hypothetical protein